MNRYADILDGLGVSRRVRSGVRCRPEDTLRLRQLLATGFDVVAVEPSGTLCLELVLQDA